MKLTKSEMKETMFVTFGRIVTSARMTGDERLIALVEKFNKDMSKAKIEPDYNFDRIN